MGLFCSDQCNRCCHRCDCLVNSYGLNGEGSQAVELFHRIPRQLIDDVTYVCVLNACSHSGLVDQARAIFSRIENKSDPIYTTMVREISFHFFFDDRESCSIDSSD